jgi:hypothetical protein
LAILLICIYAGATAAIVECIKACLSLMVIMQITCLIQNELKVNYLVAFAAGILWEELQQKTTK